MVEYKDRLVVAMHDSTTLSAFPERSRIQRLADTLGLSYQAIKKVLDGKSGAFSALNNANAATFLGVDATWLATGQGQMTPASVQQARLDKLRLHVENCTGSYGYPNTWSSADFLAKESGRTPAFWYAVLQGQTEFSNQLAREAERELKLPAQWLDVPAAPIPRVMEPQARFHVARVPQSELPDVFADWRLHASPISLEVIEGLSLLAQKNALREEDWLVIKTLMLRFGKP